MSGRVLLMILQQHSPVEPDSSPYDFSISDSYVVYTAKDPELSLGPLHTRQNVSRVLVLNRYHSSRDCIQIYIVDLEGESSPRQITTGEQGTTGSPVFSHAGDRVAWVEMPKDKHYIDR